MSGAGIAAAIWALAATATALLPMRYQYAPGLTLLICAPLLIIWIGISHSIWIAALAICGFLSMFRNPLICLYRRARGQHPSVPK